MTVQEQSNINNTNNNPQLAETQKLLEYYFTRCETLELELLKYKK